MKSTEWEIEIDGYKYQVDRTFDDCPAIYYADAIKSCGHVYDPWQKPPVESPLEQGCVAIIARRVSV